MFGTEPSHQLWNVAQFVLRVILVKGRSQPFRQIFRFELEQDAV